MKKLKAKITKVVRSRRSHKKRKTLFLNKEIYEGMVQSKIYGYQ